jgi:hypothetical protein
VASNLTLASGDLRPAADAIRLSTVRTIKQNLARRGPVMGAGAEAYYPDLGTPAVRDMQFVVTDGKSWVEPRARGH